MEPDSSERLAFQHNQDVFACYKSHERRFSLQQWLAVRLKFDQGKSTAEIARIMGRAPSTVSALLSRAERVLETSERELRSEAYRIRRTLEVE